jgi:hypothetical protein
MFSMWSCSLMILDKQRKIFFFFKSNWIYFHFAGNAKKKDKISLTSEENPVYIED